jgi:hypothetical protein
LKDEQHRKNDETTTALFAHNIDVMNRQLFWIVAIVLCLPCALAASFDHLDGNVLLKISKELSMLDNIKFASVSKRIRTALPIPFVPVDEYVRSLPKDIKDNFSDMVKSLTFITVAPEYRNGFFVINSSEIVEAGCDKYITRNLENYRDSVVRNVERYSRKDTNSKSSPYMLAVASDVRDTVRVYVSLNKYGSEEIIACINDAHDKITNECIARGIANKCGVYSFVCGLSYETKRAGIQSSLG